MINLDYEDALRTAKNESRAEGIAEGYNLQDISDITGLSDLKVEELSNNNNYLTLRK
ncbi:16185_t:CDS:2 [Funneliformis caledonium]|uniref:16185_t:CDS:1 n=1 Tax=Funneliformis caledonium TaxID=1117310 RepID=A0A9N9N631_9GLOM|nr:16185_t:CDS:2 [Funneliformis caledonium]